MSAKIGISDSATLPTVNARRAWETAMPVTNAIWFGDSPSTAPKISSRHPAAFSEK